MSDNKQHHVPPPPADFTTQNTPVPTRNNTAEGDSDSHLALGLGIASIAGMFFFPILQFVTGPMAIYFGRRARQRGTNELSQAKAGEVMGWVSVGLTVLYIVIIFLAIGLAFNVS